MNRNAVLICLAGIFALAAGSGYARAMAANPSFSISAGNTTMPSSGNGSIRFTLASVNGYEGQVAVACGPPNTPPGVRVPVCVEGGPAVAFTLTAHGTATGSFQLSASPLNPTPVRLNLSGRKKGVWALACALMLGIWFPGGKTRRSAYRSARLLLAIFMLIGLAGIDACGSVETLTPGTYAYTLSAQSVAQSNPLPSLSASTTVNVTVPPGVPVH